MSLDEIIKSMSQEYLEKAALKLSKTGIQKTLAQDKIAVNISHIKEKLSDRVDFLKRLERLSGNALEIFHYVSISGYSLEISLTVHGKFSPETGECIDNFVLFPVPDGKASTRLVIPLEYAIYSLDNEHFGFLTLLKALVRIYTFNQIISMGRKLGVNRSTDKISMVMDTYRRFLDGASGELKRMNEAEKRLFQFIEESNGIVSWDVIENKFQLGIFAGYYGPDVGSLIGASVSTGNPMKSLLLKGLLIPVLGDMYSEVRAMAIPEEIYIAILRDKLTADRKARSSKDSVAKIPSIKMPGTRLFENLKAVMAAIYYLQTRNKRINVDVLSRYLSITETDILYAIAMGYQYGLLDGTNTKMSLVQGAMNDLDRDGFYEIILKKTLEYFAVRDPADSHDFQETISVIASGILRNYLYDMKEPATVKHIMDDISSSEAFLVNARHLKSLSLSMHDLGSTQKSGNKTKPVSMEDSIKSLLELHLSLLSKLGYILVSSDPIEPDTSILPDREFIKILDNPSEIDKIRLRLKGKDDVRVLPDFEILVDIGTKFSSLARIIRFADLEKIDRICVLRLTPKSIMGALNAGVSGKDIIQLLQGKSSTGLPENVRQTILDVAGNSHVVNVIRCSAILRVDDPLTLDRIASDPLISQMIQDRVDRNIAALKEDISLSKLVTEMRKKGFVVPFALEEARRLERRRNYGRAWDW